MKVSHQQVGVGGLGVVPVSESWRRGSKVMNLSEGKKNCVRPCHLTANLFSCIRFVPLVIVHIHPHLYCLQPQYNLIILLSSVSSRVAK